MNKIKATVSGRIQKVGYRAKVIGIAKELGLTGFIQNLDDGRVKIIAESKNGDFGKFLDAIRIKNTLIDVFDVEVEYADATGNFADVTDGFDDFYKLVGGGETDERLDTAADYLKEMIGIMRDGFSDMRTGFSDMRTGFSEMKEEMRTGFSEMKEEMRTGFGNLNSRVDVMVEKQDETTTEIRGLREDLKTYTDQKFEELESELDVIKVALKSNGILC
ncbi:MAG: acylphosphatase [Euryarchaeota archaeon]|nr:acylphosphatase [Euryarchaeota archaeon]